MTNDITVIKTGKNLVSFYFFVINLLTVHGIFYKLSGNYLKSLNSVILSILKFWNVTTFQTKRWFNLQFFFPLDLQVC